MRIKLILLLCFTALISACAGAYKPSPNVLDMRSKMSKAQAARVVKSAIANPDRVAGLCKGNGIGEGIHLSDTNQWSLNEKKPEVKVTSRDMSFNALQYLVSYSTSGNIATQGAAGLNTTTSTKYAGFRQAIKFSQIEKITLKPDSGMMTRRCYRPDGYTEVIFDLNTGFGFWFELVLKNQDVENFIAAMMVLVPQAAIQTG